MPTEIGEYAILEELGRGSTGVVYLAEQLCAPHLRVALKLFRAAAFADELELEKAMSEVVTMGELRHPNIVQIYDARGLDQGDPYFVMQYIKGQSLDKPAMQEHYSDPERAARLIVTVARAVQYAHERLVVHLDLKPSNILLHDDGGVYVSDFSLARRLRSSDDEELGERSLGYAAPEQVQRRAGGLQVPRPGEGGVGGTAGYMAQEQLPQADGPLSTACDVYGLGATLYELLTGRVPHDVDNMQDLEVSFRTQTVVPPRELAPNISRELELVCLGAIEPDPGNRYRSAAALADDLERALESKPVAPPNAPPPGVSRRTQLWMRRHPLLAIGALIGALLLTVGDLLIFRELLSHEEQARKSWLADCTRWAEVQAGVVLDVFRADAARLRAAANDPAIRPYLSQEGSYTVDPAPLAKHRGEFKSLFLVRADQKPLARTPPPQPPYLQQRTNERDYFWGAVALEPGQVYVAKAYRSVESADDTFKFAYSMPLFEDGKLAGVLVATREASKKIGHVQIDDNIEGAHLTTLIGPRDPSDGEADSPFSVIVHARLRPSPWDSSLPQSPTDSGRPAKVEEHPLDAKLAATLEQAFPRATFDQLKDDEPQTFRSAQYIDPVLPSDGPHIAGMAAVGRTGYVVVVHVADSKVLGPTHRLFAVLASLATALHLSLLLLVAWSVAGTFAPRRR